MWLRISPRRCALIEKRVHYRLAFKACTAPRTQRMLQFGRSLRTRTRRHSRDGGLHGSTPDPPTRGRRHVQYGRGRGWTRELIRAAVVALSLLGAARAVAQDAGAAAKALAALPALQGLTLAG